MRHWSGRSFDSLVPLGCMRSVSTGSCSLKVAQSVLRDAFFGADGNTSRRNGVNGDLSALAAYRSSCRRVIDAKNDPSCLVSSTDILDSIPDLAERLLRSVRGSIASSSRKLPPPFHQLFPLTHENDIVDTFVNTWLNRYVQPLHSSDSISAIDVLVAVDQFHRFLNGTSFDKGRLHLHPLPRAWLPRSSTGEESIFSDALHYLVDHKQEVDVTRVLDVGCGSGYMADVLLKAGCSRLLCVDHDSVALEATEMAMWSHFFSRRSQRSGRTVEVLQRALLPTAHPKKLQKRSGDGQENNGLSVAGRVGEAALRSAMNRRKLGRAHRSGVALDPKYLDEAAAAEASMSPSGGYTLAALHISTQRLVFDPISILEEESYAQHNAPYACHDGFHQVLDGVAKLVDDPSVGTLLLVLPDPVLLHCGDGERPHLSVNAIQRVMRPSGFALAHHSRRVIDSTLGGTQGQGLMKRWVAAHGPSSALGRHQWLTELSDRMANTGTNLYVFRRREGSASSIASGASQRAQASTVATSAPEWKDTFEFDQYMSKKGPANPFHWSEAVPSFQHLELSDRDDFGQPQTLSQRNDPSTAIARSPQVAAVNHKAVQNLGTLFGHELRSVAQRRSKARKMSFASRSQVEWYLDEKIVKSEATKVSTLNEVLKKMDDIHSPQ